MMKIRQKKLFPGAGSGARDYTLYGMLLPILFELIFAYVCGSIHQIILNQFSTQAVAATTITGTFMSLMVTTFAIFYTGQSILLAPCWGRKEYDESRQILTVGLIDNLLLGIAIAAVWFAGSSLILRVIQVPEELWEMSDGYLAVLLGLSVFQGITATMATTFRAIGRMKTAMLGSCLINGSWIVSEFLILRLIPMGKQDIRMYAFAAALAHILGSIFYLWMAVRDEQIHLKFFHSNWQTQFRATTGRIARFGVFSGAETLIYMLSQTIVIAMIGELGTRALLVKGYVANLTNYIILPAAAVPIATATLIGMSIGRQDENQMLRYFRQSVRLILVATVLVEIVCLFLGRPFFRMYISDPLLLEECMRVLEIAIAMELFHSMAALIVNSLKAIGDVRMPFLMVILGSLLNIWISWLLGLKLGFGLPGIWAGYAADMAFRALMGFLLWKRHVRNHSYPVWK